MPTSTTDPRPTATDETGDYTLRPSSAVGSSRIDASDPGVLLGYVQRRIRGRRVEVPIYSAGHVKMGDEVLVLGVVANWRPFFAVRQGKLVRLEVKAHRQAFAAKAPPLKAGGDALRIWADNEARRFLELAVRDTARDPLLAAAERYRRLVSTIMHRTLVELAVDGIERDPGDFARGVSSTWKTNDLLHPREITINHAVYVALVFSLRPDEAGDLISRAAYLQLGMPVVDATLGAKMYAHAMGVLARGCPTWWASGKATSWGKLGTSIDLVFNTCFHRALSEASVRDVPFEHLIGASVDRMMLGTEG